VTIPSSPIVPRPNVSWTWGETALRPSRTATRTFSAAAKGSHREHFWGVAGMPRWRAAYCGRQEVGVQ
jgi:hypothetical protein